MKFLADVNIPQSVIISLTKKGYDVLDIKKEDKSLPDTEVVKRAQKERRVIITKDKQSLR